MALRVPQPLKREHGELHSELVKGLKSGGKTERMAKAVAKLLHPHFVKEEEFALPPLGVLSAAAKGRMTANMRQALGMTEKLKRELPRMLREHKTVLAALKKLAAAARKEKKTDYVRFAEKLALHAKMEEEVLYPAAILVGELLKHRFHKQAGKSRL